MTSSADASDSGRMFDGTDIVPSGSVQLHIQRAVEYLISQQHPEGFVQGDVVWSPIITAQYILTAHMTGMKIAEQEQVGFLSHFEVTQLEDGSWGLHAESPGYLFVTALVYVAIRLLGVSSQDTRCLRARNWMAGHGRVEGIPAWGRIWLAMLNLYGYEGIQPVLPELWLLPKALPIHPSRLFCHTRMIYMGFSYLYAVRFQTPLTALTVDLRAELYTTTYEQIDFAAYRNFVASTDELNTPHWLLRVSNTVAGMYERLYLTCIRDKALRRVLEMIVFHEQQNEYAALSPVNGLLNVLVLYHAQHPECSAAFMGMDYWVWEDETLGRRLNGAGSHTWDTAFAVQALCDTPLTDYNKTFLDGAACYLRESQLLDDFPQSEAMYLDHARGGFCMNDRRHGWTISDCTAEAISAVCSLYDRVDPAFHLDPAMLVEAVHFILSRQNDNGGFSSYERCRGPAFLEHLNPSEMFRNCMLDRSYIECTGSCLHALRHVLDRFASQLSATDCTAIQRACRRGVDFLRTQQQLDGSWTGAWGINYSYGTLFAVSGLLAGGVAHDDPAIIRACRRLIAMRLPDGGWGESWRSCVEGRPIAHERSQVIMTSWALLTLLRARSSEPDADEAIASGIQLLRERQLPTGEWPRESVAGVFFGTAMLHYDLYRTYFPLWALGLYAQSILELSRCFT